MKTLRLHHISDFLFHDEPAPVPKKGEVLLHIRAVGICGSDLHWYQDGGIGDAHLNHPLVLGYEFSAVTETGQRVAVEPSISCEHCEYCLRGDPNLCENLIFAGHGSQDGALRQMMAWPERCIFPLTDQISDAEGVLLEPLGVAIHAVDLAKLQAGMNVGVFGVGPIGLLIIQLAHLAGAREIIATDKLPHRLVVARSFGATRTIQVYENPDVNELMAQCDGYDLDVIFEVAGENEAVEAAIASVRPGGKVILAGIPGDDRTSFTASTARRKGLTLKLIRRMGHTYPRAIQLVQSGQIDVRSLVSHSYPFDQAAEAFNQANQRSGLKVVILF